MSVQAPQALDHGVLPPDYRLPPDAHVGAVRLQVSDLDRSLAYYQPVLGLGVLERSDGVAFLGAEGGLPIVELHERPGAEPVPRRGRLGLYHFAILLPDRPALGRFVRHLGELDVRAGMSDHLVSEAIYLYDPDGLGIEVCVDRPRDAWQYEGRQLVMDTRPLDVESLVGAGGGERWTGVPPGTAIGHVHLFVGDLAPAEAFYHAGLGFAKTVWSYPGALFMAAGGYHHHVATNTWAAGAPPAREGDARLLEWELIVPAPADASAVLASASAGGAAVQPTTDGGIVRDPWGTTVHVRARRG